MQHKMKNSQHTDLMSVLKYLLVQNDLTANGLANKLNIPTPTIHRLATGDVQDPRISTLTYISDYFGITVEQLLGRQPLDENFLPSRPPYSIPLLSIKEAHSYKRNLKLPKNWFQWQTNLSNKIALDNTFAIPIKNNFYEPNIAKGSVIIVNTDYVPETGNYVLVNFLGDFAVVIKQYISEGKRKYLASLASKIKTIDFNSAEMKIIGVIVEIYRNCINEIKEEA